MAPQNGSAKARKQGNGANKPANNAKPVVPAIPLPFVKRRAAAEAAAAAAAASACTPKVPERDDTPADHTSASSRNTSELTNGAVSVDKKHEVSTNSSAPEEVGSNSLKDPELNGDALQNSNSQEAQGAYWLCYNLKHLI